MHALASSYFNYLLLYENATHRKTFESWMDIKCVLELLWGSAGYRATTTGALSRVSILYIVFIYHKNT